MADYINPILSPIVWPILSLSIPIDPHLIIPPIIITPIPGEPGDFVMPDIPTPVFDTIDTSQEPQPTTITIPTPPIIDISDIVMVVPELDVTIPEANVVWAYEEYISAIIASTELQAANLDNLFDNLWTGWMTEQNNIWTPDSFNLVSVMGYVDIMSPYKLKELAYMNTLFAGEQEFIKEEQRVKNLKLYIGTMLSAEKQKRQQYAQQKDLELLWAKDMVSKSIEAYNLAIKAYAARIGKYKIDSDVFRTVIDNNTLRLKLFEELINIEKLKMEINRSLIERYKIEVAVQISLINLYKSQMEVVKIISEIESIDVDTYRLGLEVFINQIKQISEKAKQDTISADVAMMQVELNNPPIWIQDLSTKYQALQSDLTIAEERYSYAVSDFNDKYSAILDIDSTFPPMLGAETTLIGDEAGAVTAREQVANERELARLQVEQAHVNAAIIQQGFEDAIKSLVEMREVVKINERFSLEIFKTNLETQDYVYKQNTATTLKDASLVNIFTEYANTTPPG